METGIKKRVLLMMAAFIVAVSAGFAEKQTAVCAAGQNVGLNTSFKTLRAGQTGYKLKLKNNRLNWKIKKAVSSNKKVAAVYRKTSSYVLLKGKRTGRAVIKVRIKTSVRKRNDSKTLRCVVKVVPKKKNVRLNTSFKTLRTGQKPYKLKLKNNDLHWKIKKAVTSDKAVAAVYKKTSSYVMIKGKRAGRATVRIKIQTAKRKKNYLKTLTCRIKVVPDTGTGSILLPQPEPAPAAYCTVSFSMNDGTGVIYKLVHVLTGARVLEPDLPVKEGYIFEGWYMDSRGEQKYDFNTEVTGDMMLYAGWSSNDGIDPGKSCVVSFDRNDTGAGSSYASQVVQGGAVVPVPEDPVRDGYVFDGWYLDRYGNEYFGFDTVITQDTVLYAKWIRKDEASAFFSLTQEEADQLNSVLYGERKSKDAALEMPLSPDQAISSVRVNCHLDKGTGNVGITPVKTGTAICRTAGIIGTPVDIHLVGNDTLKSAQVTFSYNENSLPSGVNPSSLSAAWYDPKEKVMKLVDSAVHTAAHTITFETSHFSEYCIVDTQAWFQIWNREQLIVRDSDQEGNHTRFHAILILDTSGSMSGSDIASSCRAANAFVDQLMDEDFVSIIPFSSKASVLVQPCMAGENRENIQDALNSLKSSGGTNFNAALNTAAEVLTSGGWNENTDKPMQNVVVFMSDGQSSVSQSVLARYALLNTVTIAVGVGSGVRETALRQIADASENGQYVFCNSADDLILAFEQIQARNIGSRKDTDGDGIPDIVETSGMRDQYGDIHYTDPENADTDGDGFSDGYEMGTFVNASAPYFSIISSPTTPTHVSDEVRVSLLGDLSEDFLRINNASDISAFSRRHFTAKVESVNYSMAWDLLSDTVYDQPDSFTVRTESSDVEIENVDVKRGGVAGGCSQTWEISFDVCTKKNRLKDFNGMVVIAPDKGEEIKKEAKIDFYWDWRRFVTQILNDQKKKLEADAGKIAYAVKKDQQTQKNSFENHMIRSVSNAPKAVQEWMDSFIAERLRMQADADYNDLFTNADNIVQDCWKAISADRSVKNKVIQGVPYEIVFNELGVEGTGYFSASITPLNAPGHSYVYEVVNSKEEIMKTVDNYLKQLKVLGDSAVKDCVLACIEDTAGIYLGFDDIPKLVKAWTGTKTSQYIEDVLKAAGIKFGSGVLLDKAYDVIVKTDRKVEKTSSLFSDYSVSTDTIEEIAEYMGICMNAYDEFTKIH